ncbi:MAG: RNA-binding protein [Lachnospiraceae bacterium]|nr:RNA-binding protein [Lachnospiraceae bacterium]
MAATDAFFSGRIRDLYIRSQQNNYVTHTGFLSLSEQAQFSDIIKELGQTGLIIRDSEYVFYGGFDAAERQIACFLPEYITKEDFTDSLANDENSLITCLTIKPVNAKYSDELTHRDFLGAIMNLGLERDRIGDILCSPEYSALAVLPEAAALIENELTRVKHTTVMCSKIPFNKCDLRPKLKEVHINIASERADAIIGSVFHLSRNSSQELIRSGLVSVNGREVTDAGSSLKPGDRISVRSKGKFIYEGAGGLTRKGRTSATVSLYV